MYVGHLYLLTYNQRNKVLEHEIMLSDSRDVRLESAISDIKITVNINY